MHRAVYRYGDVLVDAGCVGPKVGSGKEDGACVVGRDNGQAEISRIDIFPGGSVAALQEVLLLAHGRIDGIVDATLLQRDVRSRRRPVALGADKDYAVAVQRDLSLVVVAAIGSRGARREEIQVPPRAV